MRNQIITPLDLGPKVVTLPQLRRVLLRYTLGWSWAEDAIVDLWKMGAPDPMASVCPKEPPCPTLQCEHVKRVLLPTQFKQWWMEVQQRMSYEIPVGAIHGEI